MPTKKTYAKKRRVARPNRKKKYVRKGRKATITRLPLAFPDTTVMKMNYYARCSATSTAGSTGQYVFRANGPYDPDFSSTGSQPLRYDIMSQIYDRYTVYGSSIKVQPIDIAATKAYWDIAVTPVNDTSIISSGDTFEQIRSMKYSRTRMLNNNDNCAPIKSYLTTAKKYGIPKMALAVTEEFSALINTVPVNPWYWVISSQPCDRATTATLYFEVVVSYFVRFDRIDDDQQT